MRTFTSFLIKLIVILSCCLYLLVMLNIKSIMPMLRPLDVKENLPKFGALNEKPIHGAIVQLHKNGRGFCSGFVIDANYVMTAAHCVDDFYGLTEDPINIYDENGKYTGVTGTAVAMSNTIDVALIKGNFKRFFALKVDFYSFSPTNARAEYVTCGFPGLQNKLTCNNFTPTHNSVFNIAGKGFLIPGMSGGPVIRVDTQEVIGVNSAATNGFVLVAPALGMLGMFGVE